MLVDPFIIPFIPCFHVLFRKVTADTGFPQRRRPWLLVVDGFSEDLESSEMLQLGKR
jgi:hypothetical protein